MGAGADICDEPVEDPEAGFLASLEAEDSLRIAPRNLADSKPPIVSLTLADIKQRIVPLTLAQDQRLPVPDELTAVLPQGLRRGSTVEVAGSGATSFLFKMISLAMAQGSWMAAVGLPSIGWLAAEQQGVPLHQVVTVDDPPPGGWGAIMAALVDAFDLVVVAPHHAGTRDARRIRARARERGSVVLCLGRGWPQGADLQVDVRVKRWSGLGWGHGHVWSCWAQVQAQGRAGQRFREIELLLAGEKSPPWVQEHAPGYAGVDIHQLAAAGSDQTKSDPLRRVG